MTEKKEENIEMNVLTQEEIKERVSQNSIKFKNTIEQVTSEIQKQNLRKGRVRPKDPTEALILEKFEDK